VETQTLSHTPNDSVNQCEKKILLLEDDPDLQQLICDYYKPRGFEIVPHGDPTIPLAELQRARDPNQLYDLVLTDLRMPHMDGMEFIDRMKKLAPKIPIVLMTAHSSVELAMKAIESGAYDFVVKPLHFQQLSITLARALHMRQVLNENQLLRTAVKSAHSFSGIVGKSQAMKSVFDLARRVAQSAATVLITGESGTGKEVIARYIHQNSARKTGPFIAINCSAIPENLLEAELFGYAKGAFTGAADKKIGLFEEAEGGVLFLDEIGDLSLGLQAKFLRVLQERKIKRVGENVFRPINVRILAATHKDLAKETRENRFREDLFFRLNVIPVKIPPLRERPEDILPLAEHFLGRFSLENESGTRTFSKSALDHLLKLQWRGNVRELENAIERAVVLAEGPEINIQDLPPTETSGFGSLNAPVVEIKSVANIAKVDFGEKEPLPSLDEFILDYVAVVLKRVSGVKEQAARILNIDRKTLYRRIHELEDREAKKKSDTPELSTGTSSYAPIPLSPPTPLRIVNPKKGTIEGSSVAAAGSY